MKRFGALFAALAAFGLVACGGSTSEEATGGIALSISGPGAAQVSGALRQAISETDAASKITQVIVGTAAENDKCNSLGNNGAYQVYSAPTFPITDAQFFKGFNAGCVISVTAWAKNAAGVTLYEATSAPIAIEARQMIGVNLILQQVVDPGSVAVRAPMISAIVISDTTPEIDAPVRLTATVSAAASATSQWSVACASEQYLPIFEPTGRAFETDLTLRSCSGPAVVTFSVTNPGSAATGNGPLTSTIQFTLNYVAQGIVPNVSLNSYPNIFSIATTSNTAPVPGGTVNLVAVVSDPDGDEFDLVWTDDCGGSFAGQGTLTPVWTAPAVPGRACTLSLDVNEKDTNAEGHTGGFNSATFTLQVAPAVLTLQPYIDVCTPGVWTCTSVASYENASSYVDPAGALQLVKAAADSSTIAFGPNARILGVTGMVFESASFNAEGNGIGAGTPRFYLQFQDSTTCALDAPVRVGSSFTFAATPTCGAAKALSGLDIIADMGGQIGSVTITDIFVNDIAVK